MPSRPSVLPLFRLLAPGSLLLALSSATAQMVPDVALAPTTLPAGAELVRSYDTDRVAVQVVSQPFFGATSAEWATVEVGPASLAFLREKNGGAVLLLGDQPLSLPDALALGPDGRSAAPFSFELSYDRVQALAILEIGARSFSVPAASAPGPLQVVISAGTKADWRLDSLRVEPSTPPAGPPVPTSVGKPAGLENAKTKPPSPPVTRAELATAALAQKAGIDQATTLVAAAQIDQAISTIDDLSPHPRNSAEWHFSAATAFTKVALALAAKGRSDQSAVAVRLALARLTLVVDRAASADGDLIANALELSGWLEERFIGDRQSAIAAYRLAEQHSPQSRSAARAARRLAAQEEESVLKHHEPRG